MTICKGCSDPIGQIGYTVSAPDGGEYHPGCYADHLHVVEAARATVTASELAQLSALHSWLESRGLPETWMGPFDVWAQVVTSSDGKHVRGYCHAGWTFADLEREFCRARTWNLIRWDRATPAQREAARALRDEKGTQ